MLQECVSWKAVVYLVACLWMATLYAHNYNVWLEPLSIATAFYIIIELAEFGESSVRATHVKPVNAG